MVAGAQPVGGESVSEAPVVPVTTAPDVVMPAVDAPRAEPAGFRTRWESWTHAIFTLREDRFFLLLAVFIGIFSGLVVVCFRLAIEWTQITLLGPSLSPSFPRVVLAPAIAGIAVALLAIHVFPRVRGSGVNQVKSAMYISNGYVSFTNVIGKFVACALAIGSGQSLGPEGHSLLIGAGAGGSFAADGRGDRIADWPELAAFAGKTAPDRAGGRRGGLGGCVQRADFGCAVRDRRSDWNVERRSARRDRAGRRFERRDDARVPGSGLTVPRPAVSSGGPGRSSGIRSAGRGRRRCFAGAPEMDCRGPAQDARASALDGIFSAGRGWIADRIDRHTLSASDGSGIRHRGPGHARAICVAITFVAGGAKVARYRIFVFERDAGRHVCAYDFYRGDVGRRGGFHRASFFPRADRDDRNIRAGGDRDFVRGLFANTNYFGVHGD